MTFSIGQKVECVDDTRSIGGVENCHVNFGTVERITKARLVVRNEHGNCQWYRFDGTCADWSDFPRRIRPGAPAPKPAPKQKRTVSLAPTWTAVLPIYLRALRYGGERAQESAELELRQMAKLADAYNAQGKKGGTQ